jgi:hypothetical protein
MGLEFIHGLPGGDEVIEEGGTGVAHGRFSITLTEPFPRHLGRNPTFDEQKRDTSGASHRMGRSAVGHRPERGVDHHRPPGP